MAKDSGQFDLDRVPLAILSRMADLNNKVDKVEKQTQADAERIEILRRDIEAIRQRMADREQESEAIRVERDALAFAVKAYQDETEPRREPTGLGKPIPVLSTAPSQQPIRSAKMQAALDAIVRLGSPTAKELRTELGLGFEAIGSFIGTLRREGMVTAVGEKGGWRCWGAVLPNGTQQEGTHV